jgi:hypothetical protein
LEANRPPEYLNLIAEGEQVHSTKHRKPGDFKMTKLITVLNTVALIAMAAVPLSAVATAAHAAGF